MDDKDNNDKSGSEDKKLTETQAAEMLGVKAATLNKWRSRKQGPIFIRVPRDSKKGRIHYRSADVMKFLESCRIDPEAPIEPTASKPKSGVRKSRSTRRGSR